MKTLTINLLGTLLAAMMILPSCQSDKPEQSEKNGTDSADISYTDADFAGTFIGSFDMTMELTMNGQLQQNNMPATTYYSNGKQTAIVMRTGNSTIHSIFYPAENEVITLMNEGGKKIAIKMGIPNIQADTDLTATANAKVTETGEKKDIEGYPCRKYLIETDKGSSEVWITNKIKGNMYDVLRGKGERKISWGKEIEAVKGFPLEITTTANDGTVSVVKIQNVRPGKVDESMFSTEGYEIKDMSSMNKLIEKAAKKYTQ
jgi:hypothetical protein